MASDFFLKIDGIPGESLDANHKDEIEVFSFSWGVTQGRAAMHDIHFVTRPGRSSPKLFMAACQGRSPGNATFVARKTGDKPVEYLKIKLTDILVSSVNISATGADDAPTETLTLGFRSAEVQVASQGPSTGPGDVEVGVCEPARDHER